MERQFSKMERELHFGVCGSPFGVCGWQFPVCRLPLLADRAATLQSGSPSRALGNAAASDQQLTANSKAV
jgi:hypothetical protein